jgi:hypothetical protein
MVEYLDMIRESFKKEIAINELELDTKT